MKTYDVQIQPEAREHLAGIYEYISENADPYVAKRYVDAIAQECSKLATFPERGSRRDDIGAGLRSVTFSRRCLIVYAVGQDEVAIIGIFYGGQNVIGLFETN